ncbi:MULTISPECIES: XdhC family protein [Agrobacterium]|uniref:XdhC family protein n=1 Tax=Agrobacterium tumefaciens TaxID=358 RepID=A0AAE6BH18_AGRTU|nr:MULTISPECIES: XdhC family protein [Agrobacterium]QCL77197.1 XdhC family protein [Agrobacterium tumefaciens]QCL82705.1 XdhC family protein [Agrobacterium tumefaciens]CUX70459.1 conserved hypothetical protein; putative XdhC/CoxI family protein [Agrobacterium sp. NCPPB 925]
MRLDTLKRLNIAREQRIAVALLTDLVTGDEILLLEGTFWPAGLGEGVKSAFRDGRSRLLDERQGGTFLNVYLPSPRIVIIGAVHISQFLAQMAMVAGFEVRIVDPRTAFATVERFPGVNLSADWPADAFLADPLDRYTAVVALTHDPKIDDFPLADALRTGCFYIGALGSRATHASRIERLSGEGIDADALLAIHAPIGLDIGASNPAEIAVAILAEIIQALRVRNHGHQGVDR